MTRAALAACLALGCGLGAGSGGGSDLLPTAGLGPYGKVTDLPMSPFAIVENAADLRDPTALARPFGGFRVWFTRETDAETAIYVSDLASAHETPAAPPVRVLEDAAAPSVVRAGDEIFMYYERAGGIALAVSADDGASFTHEAEVLPDGRSPGAARFGDEIFLYVERDDGIHALIASDGRAFTEAGLVLERRATEAQAFDRQWLGDPAPVGEDDRVVLFYAGRNVDGEVAIGAAASRDGVTFERAGRGEPILEPGMRDESGPSAVLFPAQGVLFFTQAFAQVTAIGVATSP